MWIIPKTSQFYHFVRDTEGNNGMAVPTAMSIFTGYDGIGLGLKRAIPTLRTICYLEREIFPVCNLVAKIKENKLDDAPA